MSDQSNLLPPSDGSFGGFGPITPSGLTPNTRSEAEAALTHNSTAQTDSAAPDPTLVPKGDYYGTSADGTTEAQKAYRRPGVARTSSANYELALKRAQQASVSSNMSTDTSASDSITGDTVASPPSSSSPFPPPGRGVVPLNYGVGASPTDPIKKTRSRGLSLSGLAQQQGWSEQEYKRIYNAELMEKPKDEAGYNSEVPKNQER
ncbi:Nn.00g028110.m01.CDS01 [Neocucurbitaria sp. VM-36]